jgi:hypothetical protein
MYGDRSKALCDLDAILANPSATKVRELLLPTANLQELSMECGWGSHFNDLAAKLERLLGIEQSSACDRGCVKTQMCFWGLSKFAQIMARRFHSDALTTDKLSRIRVGGQCLMTVSRFHTAWTRSGRRKHDRADGMGSAPAFCHQTDRYTWCRGVIIRMQTFKD